MKVGHERPLLREHFKSQRKSKDGSEISRTLALEGIPHSPSFLFDSLATKPAVRVGSL